MRQPAFWWTLPGRRKVGTRLTDPSSPTRSTRDAPNDVGPQHSLLGWIFLVNASVVVIAAILLAVTPIEISAPIAVEQLVLIAFGLGVLLALDFVLLRRLLAPLVRLTEVMASVDPDRPGRRLPFAPFSREGAALAKAFDGMLDRLESARRQAARTSLAAQEAERLRVARELHDEIGQTLTAVVLQAERAAEGDPAVAQHELSRVAEAVHDSLDEVRRISRELRPEALDDLGLINALIALCSRVSAESGPQIRRELDSDLPPLSPDVELVVYRIAQEGLTNALRHAEATTATLTLKVVSESVYLAVEDDGRGMPADVPEDSAGIAGMRERALLVGGQLSIESPPGGGTRVCLRLPLSEDDS